MLPAHLDLVAIGLAAALVPALSLRQRRAALAVAVVAVLLAVAVLGSDPLDSKLRILVHIALGTIVAAAVVAAMSGGSWRRFHRSRVAPWLVVGCGGVLWFEPVLAQLARHSAERYTPGYGVGQLTGPIAPALLWTLLIGSAAAAAVFVVVQVPLVWGWRRVPSALPGSWQLAVGGIVSGAFAWRVVTLFTVAPERTDGGDPLFYHTTANVLAQGRGYIEPLNWIAYGHRLPSALHGPLFPSYLAFFARLGGTTYLDNKLASCIIGAGTVLLCRVHRPSRRRAEGGHRRGDPRRRLPATCG